jgi:hypothetical protein
MVLLVVSNIGSVIYRSEKIKTGAGKIHAPVNDELIMLPEQVYLSLFNDV